MSTNYYKLLAGCTGVVGAVHYRGHVIEQRVTGYAYPRNGNAHNPTPRIVWCVRDQDGRLVGSFIPTKRDAKNYVNELCGGVTA